MKHVENSNLSMTDKDCIAEVFRRYGAKELHGKWKEPEGNLEIFKGRYVICSVCDVMLPILKELYEYDFCPRCGAQMYAGDEEGKTDARDTE